MKVSATRIIGFITEGDTVIFNFPFFIVIFSPQPLWNVKKFSVDKMRAKLLSTPPVEKVQIFHIALWKKSC